MSIKNMKDLKQKKQQLEFESKYYKKELLSSTNSLVGNSAATFRSLAFDFGFGFISRMIFSRKKKHRTDIN